MKLNLIAPPVVREVMDSISVGVADLFLSHASVMLINSTFTIQ